uniref:Uncharacterized protein n=1 Tax=Acrobeloides nanus TaxID=290746 RepID=A0A914EHG1_9BILA
MVVTIQRSYSSANFAKSGPLIRTYSESDLSPSINAQFDNPLYHYEDQNSRFNDFWYSRKYYGPSYYQGQYPSRFFNKYFVPASYYRSTYWQPSKPYWPDLGYRNRYRPYTNPYYGDTTFRPYYSRWLSHAPNYYNSYLYNYWRTH